MNATAEGRINERWVLAKRPVGEPTEDCFSLEAVPVAAEDAGGA